MPARVNTVRRLVAWAERELAAGDVFFGHGTDNAHDEAVFLVFRGLGLDFDAGESEVDKILNAGRCARVAALVERRVRERKPAAYLLNEAWFAGMPFYVDENVLIPRSPFAELIAARFAPWVEPDRVRRILEIGTGSGCIAIACAQAFPHATVDATDISDAVLAIAQRNISGYGLEPRVNALYSDVFSALGRRRYDLIISNPPYVPEAELAGLPAEYGHEPRAALAAGSDGFAVVARIIREAHDFLAADGVVLVEVGVQQQALERRFPRAPFFWPELAHGGEGIFLLRKEQLVEGGIRESFK